MVRDRIRPIVENPQIFFYLHDLDITNKQYKKSKNIKEIFHKHFVFIKKKNESSVYDSNLPSIYMHMPIK